jgi:two-component system response regulator MprA
LFPVHEPRILVVEDDAELRELLRRALTESDFEVSSAGNGRDAMERAAAARPDALVIDIGLPDADGRDLCQALRAQGTDAPVLFLTARDAVADRLAGFAAGGDDYVTKPFSIDEVLARLRALLRRAPGDEVATAGEVRLDPVAHEITGPVSAVTLTPTEFRLFATLAGRHGAVVPRADLLRAGWSEAALVHDNTLDVYIARLRRRLKEVSDTTSITTVHGVGYKLT